MVGRVSRDCIRVLGNRVAVVPVLEEPVPCAVHGGVADRQERETVKEMGAHLAGSNKSSATNTGGKRARRGLDLEYTENCETGQHIRDGQDETKYS